jgi:hypothetical protein
MIDDPGRVVALSYLTTDGRIEMCWPCRVVEDNERLLALFIAAGSGYKAGPKRTAAEKLSMPRAALPPDEYVWRRIPQVPAEWGSVAPALWEKHHWAYGRLGELGRAGLSR